jgi:hypothetical protein
MTVSILTITPELRAKLEPIAHEVVDLLHSKHHLSMMETYVVLDNLCRAVLGAADIERIERFSPSSGHAQA